MPLQGFTPRCIRHTYTTILLSKGVNPKAIATLLGHSPGSVDLIISTYGRCLHLTVRGADTMGDIVAEERYAGSVLFPDIALWRDERSSATMVGRRPKRRFTDGPVAIELPSSVADAEGWQLKAM